MRKPNLLFDVHELFHLAYGRHDPSLKATNRARLPHARPERVRRACQRILVMSNPCFNPPPLTAADAGQLLAAIRAGAKALARSASRNEQYVAAKYLLAELTAHLADPTEPMGSYEGFRLKELFVLTHRRLEAAKTRAQFDRALDQMIELQSDIIKQSGSPAFAFLPSSWTQNKLIRASFNGHTSASQLDRLITAMNGLHRATGTFLHSDAVVSDMLSKVQARIAKREERLTEMARLASQLLGTRPAEIAIIGDGADQRFVITAVD